MLQNLIPIAIYLFGTKMISSSLQRILYNETEIYL